MKFKDIITESTKRLTSAKPSVKNNIQFSGLDQFLSAAGVEPAPASTDAEIDEAEKGLGATMRPLGDKELSDYLDRIRAGEKNKTDKYKMPYIHKSNIAVKDEKGNEYDLDKLREMFTQRPTDLLRKNEKMEHSGSGEDTIFFNIGLPALKGLAVNEDTGEFVVVDTCPGAGACQLYCYAMKGGYVQYPASSLRLSRMLTFLLNDPDGFADEVGAEIRKHQRRNKNSQIVVRWHDAGDFFSPQYLELAFEIARAHPKVQFYAYTKMAGAAQSGDMPPNFKMNFSSGAKPSEEKKVKFVTTKHSRVVPKDMFDDLILKDGRKNVTDAKGRMQFIDQRSFDEFKNRLATQYGIERNSIITYDQMLSVKDDNNPRYNVIVMPGDGDESANRGDVLGTYLIIH